MGEDWSYAVPSDGVLAALVAVVASLLYALWQNRAQGAPLASPLVDETKSAAATAKSEAVASPTMSALPVCFFFGSQTGCAAGLAKKLAREAAAYNLSSEVIDLAEFSPRQSEDGESRAAAARARLSSPCVGVFLVATYGDGDPTDNARDFVSWVRDSPAGSLPILSALQFCVFGLGNRQYEHFNRTGKTLDTALAACGARRAFQYGEGDDDADLDDDFDKWRTAGLWEALCKAVVGAGALPSLKLSQPVGHGGLPSAALDWRLSPAKAPLSSLDSSSMGALADVSSRHFFIAGPAVVVENRELREKPSRGSSTRHVVLSVPSGYSTADNLYVCPENDASDVESLSKALGLDLDACFNLEPAVSGRRLSPLFPTPCSVRTALTRYLDFSGAPRKDLLAALSVFALDATQRSRLEHLSSPLGRADFSACVATPQLSILELLLSFPSVRPPLEALVQILPRMVPRAYTIASSAAVDPINAAICVSVIDTEKPVLENANGSRRLKGVASNFLARVVAGSSVMCYVRPSTFKLPADATKPVILVGPGTGIAPMRAFIQERQVIRQTQREPTLGPTILYFGCRKSDEDFIYREEIETAKESGVLAQVHVAFSREGPEKVYVQHRITEHYSHLWDLISQRDAHIYVCGATKMGSDVLEAFIKVRLFDDAPSSMCTPTHLPNPHTLLNPQIYRYHKKAVT